MVKAHGDVAGRLQASSGNENSRRNLIRVLLLTAALPVLLAFPAWAAQWDIVPALSVSETYTDNVSLAPDALAQSDWITQLTPAISIVAEGPRLRFRAGYAPQLTYYARGQKDDQIYHVGTADLNAELAKQLLFVDANASVNYYNVSLRGPLTDNNVNTTGNRARVGTFLVSPYVLRDFGSNVQAEARFTYSLVNSSERIDSQDSAGYDIHLRLATGPAHKLLTWDLAYDRGKIEYDGALQRDLDTEIILARARGLITPTVGLLGRVGYEYYKRGNFTPESNGVGWGVGLDWAPSPRTSLTAVVGRRFFGNAYQFDFRHRTRLLALSAGFDQEVTNTRQELFIPATTSTAGYLDQLYLSTFPDPRARQQAVDAVISKLGIPASLNAPVNYFSDQLFLQQRLQASVAVQGVRNIIIVNVFRTDREALVGDVLLPGFVNEQNSTKQTGTGLVWNWLISARDSWNLVAAYTRNTFPGTNRRDDLTTLQMGFTRQFQPRLSGSLSYRRRQSDSNRIGNDYTENAVFATLQMSF